jgi:hypothetical protein
MRERLQFIYLDINEEADHNGMNRLRSLDRWDR